MKTYSIKFVGYYPVGAVAVVKAKNEKMAREEFLAYLQQNVSDLAESNNDSTLEVAEIKEHITILLDGNY